jgi:transposase-like protein
VNASPRCESFWLEAQVLFGSGEKTMTEERELRLEAAVQACIEGMTLAAAAQKYGINRALIRLAVKATGKSLSEIRREQKVLMHEKFQELYNQGLTLRQIAKQSGKSIGR